MRYAAAAAVVVAMMFGVTAMAQAPKAPAGTTTITGKLTKVDVEGKALTIAVTVEKETKDTVVTCNDATRIFQMAPPVRNDAGNLVPAPRGRGTPAKFEDLKVGQQVGCNYFDATKIARMIRIIPEAAAASPATTASAPEATTPAAK